MHTNKNSLPLIIQQGATYKLPFSFKIKGQTVLKEDIQEVSFAFGEDLKKTYIVGLDNTDIKYKEGIFTVILSEYDTLSLPSDKVLCFQGRIKFNDESIKFTERESIAIIGTLFSKEVIKND